MDTEAPIRGYTQTSRQYLQKLHPQMAQYVGGTIDENGKLIEPGLWEKIVGVLVTNQACYLPLLLQYINCGFGIIP